MAAITAEDVERALKTLKGWKQKAKLRHNRKAVEECAQIARVIEALYGGKR